MICFYLLGLGLVVGFVEPPLVVEFVVDVFMSRFAGASFGTLRARGLFFLGCT